MWVNITELIKPYQPVNVGSDKNKTAQVISCYKFSITLFSIYEGGNPSKNIEKRALFLKGTYHHNYHCTKNGAFQ